MTFTGLVNRVVPLIVGVAITIFGHGSGWTFRESIILQPTRNCGDTVESTLTSPDEVNLFSYQLRRNLRTPYGPDTASPTNQFSRKGSGKVYVPVSFNMLRPNSHTEQTNSAMSYAHFQT